VIIDKWGTIRYMQSGLQNDREILLLLKQLHAEETGP
jgi:hypothetical protein